MGVIQNALAGGASRDKAITIAAREYGVSRLKAAFIVDMVEGRLPPTGDVIIQEADNGINNDNGNG